MAEFVWAPYYSVPKGSLLGKVLGEIGLNWTFGWRRKKTLGRKLKKFYHYYCFPRSLEGLNFLKGRTLLGVDLSYSREGQGFMGRIGGRLIKGLGL